MKLILADTEYGLYLRRVIALETELVDREGDRELFILYSL